MLLVVDKKTREEYLSQPLQTNKNQFKKIFTFLSGYYGIFNKTISKIICISQNQILIKLVLFKLQLHQVLAKSKTE